MEFTRADILWGILLPLVIAVATVATCWIPRLGRHSWVFGLIGAVGAFSTAFFTGQLRQPFPPSDSVQYLFWVSPAVAAATAVAEAFGWYICRTRSMRWCHAGWATMVFLASLLTASLAAMNMRSAKAVASDGFTEVSRYSDGQVWTAIAAMTLALTAAGLSLAWATARARHSETEPAAPAGFIARTAALLTPGRATSLQVWMLMVAVAIFLAVGGADPKVGPIRAGSLAIVAALWTFSRHGQGIPPAVAALTGILAATLIGTGLLYYSVQPWQAAILGATVLWMTLSSCLNNFTRCGITLLLLGIPCAITLTQFVRQMGVE
jgi:hypothetical protein